MTTTRYASITPRLALLCIVAVGCDQGAPPATASPAATAATRVELSSVTLADDCGGVALEPPAARSADQPDERAPDMAAKSRCEQTSMQLAIIAGGASVLRVKSVELFDAGRSLGMLVASKPTRWSSTSGVYEPWDEQVAAGTTSSVSYVLSQPRWDHIADRWNRRYTLKVVFSVGGLDHTLRKDVTVIAPTSLPPDVQT